MAFNIPRYEDLMQKGKERYYNKSKMWMGDILIINKNTLYFLGHQPNRTEPNPTPLHSELKAVLSDGRTDQF